MKKFLASNITILPKKINFVLSQFSSNRIIFLSVGVPKQISHKTFQKSKLTQFFLSTDKKWSRIDIVKTLQKKSKMAAHATAAVLVERAYKHYGSPKKSDYKSVLDNLNMVVQRGHM